MLIRALSATVLSGALLLTGACGGSSDLDTAIVSTSEVARSVESGAVLIDVRSPEEFAAGALDGALNIDVNGAEFEDRISELDRDAAYVIYCRSGSRAATAIDQMADLGFTDVVNGGAYDALAAEGIPTS